MSNEKNSGVYFYQKETREKIVLKEMLQLVRIVSPAQTLSFSYVEATSSLLPETGLWENLQMALAGPTSWEDFYQSLHPDEKALVNLLKIPSKKVRDSEEWEKFIVSFLKGLLGPSKNILIDVNEEIISPFLVQRVKNVIFRKIRNKVIYLASANMPLWLDCAHSLIYKNGYTFEIQSLMPYPWAKVAR